MRLLLFIPPLIFFITGIYYILYKNKNIGTFLLSICLGLIAFYTIPNESDDLYRHFETIRSYINQPIEIIFYSGYSLVYLNNFIMYIIALTGCPNLYQMIFTIIGYYFLFKMILDIYDDIYHENIKNQKTLLFIIVFIFLITFYKIYILTIRNYFCFIIGSYAIYLLRKERINNLLFLSILVLITFIHPVSLIFIVYFIFIKTKNIYIKSSIIIACFFHKYILQIILLLLSDNNYFFVKINYYLNDIVPEYNINFMIYYFILSMFSIVILFFIKKEGDKFYDTKLLYLLSIVIGLSMYYQFELIRRFMYLLPLFMIEPLTVVLHQCTFKNKRNTKYIIYFFMIGLSVASILATYANIMAYGWYLIV